MPIVEHFSRIPQLDTAAMEAARARQDVLTKPTGSLGRLEDLSIRLAGITGRSIPTFENPVIFVYAGDHGVAAQGVSAYPSEVTAQMVLNYASGGAVINTLAKDAGARLRVADIGVNADLPASLPIHHIKARKGTADWSVGPAMTTDEALIALQAGYDSVAAERESGGLDLAAVGEMGIGNTATAAALACAYLGVPASDVTGKGTGLDRAGVARKAEIVASAVSRLPHGLSAIETLAAVGGLEIAAMAGTIIAAAEARIPVIVDGFISTCAGIVASRLAPGSEKFLIAAHRSPENGHTVLLEALGLTPLLDLGMRLGEGSGAALAIPIVRSAANVLAYVATFGEAGVSNREEDVTKP